MNVNGDLRESTLYSEKIQRAKYAPSLAHFGGKAGNGWLVVSTSGSVTASIEVNWQGFQGPEKS